MEDILARADKDREQCLTVGYSHYDAAEMAEGRSKLFGVPTIVTSTVVGTAIFSTIDSSPAFEWRVVAGFLSLLAAVFSGLQTFFRFSELAESHKAAGASYGALRRQLDIFELRYSAAGDAARGEALGELEKIAARLADLAGTSPKVSAKLHSATVKRLREHRDFRV